MPAQEDNDALSGAERVEWVAESAPARLVAASNPAPARVTTIAKVGIPPVTGLPAVTQHDEAGKTAGLVANQERFESNMGKTMRTAEELVTFGQGNMEAFMKSGQIWASAVQDLGKHFAEATQAQFDETLSTFKAIAGVKSLKDAMDLQSSLARSSMDKAVAATSKLTDVSIKMSEQAFAPLGARVTLAVEKFGRSA